MRLTPNALSSNSSSWSHLRRAKSASNIAAVSSAPTSGPNESHYASRDTSPGGEHQRHHIPRPLQRDKWSKEKDGFVTTDILGAEAGNLISLPPTVWLQQAEERMCLCVYQHKNLTIILLIPFSSLANGQGMALVKKQLLENVSKFSAPNFYPFSIFFYQTLASICYFIFIYSFYDDELTVIMGIINTSKTIQYRLHYSASIFLNVLSSFFFVCLACL